MGPGGKVLTNLETYFSGERGSVGMTLNGMIFFVGEHEKTVWGTGGVVFGGMARVFFSEEPETIFNRQYEENPSVKQYW